MPLRVVYFLEDLADSVNLCDVTATELAGIGAAE